MFAAIRTDDGNEDMAGVPPKLARTPWRWAARVLLRYDGRKRPRLTAWISAAIVGVILLFGALGYVIPMLLTRMF